MLRFMWSVFVTGVLVGCQHDTMHHREPVNVEHALTATLDSLADREVIVEGRAIGDMKSPPLRIISERGQLIVSEFRDSGPDSNRELHDLHVTVRGILKRSTADIEPRPRRNEPFTPIGLSQRRLGLVRDVDRYYLIDAVILDVRFDEYGELSEQLREADE